MPGSTRPASDRQRADQSSPRTIVAIKPHRSPDETPGRAINASGQITGESYLGTTVPVHCGADRGHHVSPTPATRFSGATGPGPIWVRSAGSTRRAMRSNDLGEVVGTSSTRSGSSAFIDHNVVTTAIGDPTAINGSGEIAGGISAPVAGTLNVLGAGVHGSEWEDDGAWPAPPCRRHLHRSVRDQHHSGGRRQRRQLGQLRARGSTRTAP
jgi:hypothetical protein